MPGPIPKRSDQRRRANKPEIAVASAPSGNDGVVPGPDPEWHPIARDWFVALGRSGQSRFYEPSDWAMAGLGAEMMSSLCASGRPSSQMLASLLSLTSSLLATEGDRRRLRMELAKATDVDEDESAAVSYLARYRDKVGG